MGRVGLRVGIAVAGAAVGYALGGAGGAQLGLAAGSLVGQIALPDKLPGVVGPRLGDLQVQNSSEGAPIPRVYGSGIRVAGNVAWSLPLVEVKTSETLGGKGGPTQSSTGYTYFASFAVGFCAGPVGGIRRLWADTKLIYDISAGSTGAAFKYGSVAFNTSTINNANTDNPLSQTVIDSFGGTCDLRIYTGTETQLPDPLIEADKGVGETPAWRGLCYVVIESLPLADFGNRIPSLTAEVVNGTTSASATSLTLPLTVQRGFMLYDYNRGVLWCAAANGSSGDNRIKVDPLSESVLLYHAGAETNPGDFANLSLDEEGYLYRDTNNGSAAGSVAKLDPIAAQQVAIESTSLDHPFYVVPPKRAGGPGGTTGNLDESRGWMLGGLLGHINTFQSRRDIDGNETLVYEGTVASDSGQSFRMGVRDKNNDLWAIQGSWLSHLPAGDTVSTEYELTAYFGTDGYGIIYDEITHALLLGGGAVLLRFDIDTAAVTHSYTFANEIANADTFSSFAQRIINRRLWLMDTGTSTAYEIDVDSLDILQTVDLGTAISGTAAGVLFDPVSHALWTMAFGSSVLYKIPLDRITLGTITLDDVVSDICSLVGLESADIDVTDLSSDTVRGYVVGRRMQARAALQPLLDAFFFDGVESDGQLTWVKRGGSSAASIPDDDLGASEGTEPAEPFSEQRTQEVDIPKQLDVSFFDLNRDYQTGTQVAKRITAPLASGSDFPRPSVLSEHVQSIDLPLVLTATEAKRIAETHLFLNWFARWSYGFALSPEYIGLDPTDVLTVSHGGVSYVVRLLTTDYGGSGIVACSAVPEDPELYSSTATAGQGSGFATQTILIPTPTVLYLLDIPLLRDGDDNAGFYVAASGTVPDNWPGAILSKSSDGVGYTTVEQLFAEAVVGVSGTALADGPTTVWDTSGSVRVTLLDGTLSNTDAVSAINGSNTALLGSEVLSFQTATLVSGTTYTLSNLLRGRRGTEWATSGHAIGDRFVLLQSDGSIKRVTGQTSEIGVQRFYKASTIGRSGDQATPQSFSNTAVGLKPYAPTHIAGSRDGSNNLTITWVRRTRAGGAVRDFKDVPLSEDSEAYEVDIMSGATVLRTISGLSSETASYSAANQTTDGLTPGDPVEVNVYQLSDTVGRGYAGNATV